MVMAKNIVQFQSGISVQQFLTQFDQRINAAVLCFAGDGRKALYVQRVVIVAIAN
jgi:hypothetical protein